ncbi:TrmH family RNA methyltransferase [Aestuariivivens sediminicola]|uniref:TrmH family RNA methyltransferase n=1 Tax=Aestuariivivens sediminicola TaxID=2913560 RepID=UPI001F58EAC4|nr:RNA methyltransferase [Aestuariivivens sediminicola]
MLSKNQIKLISSLKQKKYRIQHGLFLVEGIKLIRELLMSHLELYALYTTQTFNSDANPDNFIDEIIISESELRRISLLKSPNSAVAIFKIPKMQDVRDSGLIVVLDDIRDPGNMGTIIRLCDWFGVSDLVCSPGTVDCYNPKVVQATMGSLSRVNINYTNLEVFLSARQQPVFGAFMDGENVYKTELPLSGILVMGNESNGISKKIEGLLSKKIAIPQFGSVQKTESLNVATAAAVLLSEFRRRQ